MRGIDNPAYYRLVEDDPSSSTWTTRAPATRSTSRTPHTLQLIMDSLRYWVTRDARRRLPLRPRLDPGPRVLRRRQALHLLRTRAAGSGGLAGEAHRRAVGRRPGRLPGRRVPAAVDGVERQVPRHGARLLARRAVDARRVRLPHHGLEPTSTSRTGRRPVASINFVTAHDGFTLRDLVSYNEKQNDANGEDNNDGADVTTGRGTSGVEGDRPRMPAILTLRATAAAQHPGHPAAQPGRADAAARRRARADAGRQQQRLRAGLRVRRGSTGTRRPTAA